MAADNARLMSLAPLPAQPRGTPWPTSDWPAGPIPAGVDGHRLAAMTEEVFSAPGPLGETWALVIVQAGRLVFDQPEPVAHC